MRLHTFGADVGQLASAGIPLAQSVTIYGLLDQGLQKADAEANSATWQSGSGNKAHTLAESKGSRLGFRGNEDLRGGLPAQFQIEHRFTPDNGAANSIFWAGRSYVQLTNAELGAVYLGRDYTPNRNVAERNDPFGQDGVGKFDQRAYAYYGGSRTPNMVGYRSPKVRGVSAELAVSLNEASTTTPREVSLSVVYADGPLYSGLAYSQEEGPDVHRHAQRRRQQAVHDRRQLRPGLRDADGD
jgi:predicted porin